MKLKNSNCDETQNSNGDKTKKKSNGDKTHSVTKLKNSN